jgi:site-specific recombinase XerD
MLYSPLKFHQRRVSTVTTELATTVTIANEGDYSLVQPDTNDERLAELWITKPRRGNSPHTREQYARAWVQFRDAVGVPLQAVNYETLARWVNQLTGTDNTRKLKISAIKSLFSFAQNVGYIRVNPAIMIEAPTPKESKHVKVLSESEVHAMLAHTRHPRDRAIIRTLYSAGCRISELCALTWGDVVPTKDGKAVLVIHGKGGKQREAGVSAETYKALLALQKGAPSTAPVFVSSRGKAMDRTVVHRMLSKVAKAAGLDNKGISAHWFRHSHVSHGLARGGNPETIRRQVGHASLSTTTGYAHSSDTSADYLTV